MSIIIDSKEHYQKNLVAKEFTDIDECQVDIQNIGWTLGNDCPYRCKHCYSMSAREKGKNLSEEIILKVINQLKKLNIKTLNLGGNEPLFTNGIDPKKSLLPFIIDCLDDMGISIGLTTSGITALYLEKHFNKTFSLLNDIDVSLDSPYENEHNENRGNKIFKLAIETLELCKTYNKECTIIMCAMNWNFTEDRIIEIVNLAKKYNANIRINPIKPVESKHMSNNLTIEQYYAGFSLLMKLCDNLDLTEPTLAGISDYQSSKRCPCGRKSFRIHSITPDGKIPISPCVYLHDYKVGDLLVDDIRDLIFSEAFRAFRRRNKHPEKIVGCTDCKFLNICGGGCAARAYLYNLHTTGNRTLFVKDPLCPKELTYDFEFEKDPQIISNVDLVHKDYLCTWIGRPR